MRTSRFAVLAALAAAAAALILGGVQATIWSGAAAPGFARAITRLIDPSVASGPAVAGLTEPTAAYFRYGRLAIVLYALLAGAARGAWPVLAPRVRRLVQALGGAALAGDLGAYWLSASAGPAVRRVAFLGVELPALGLIVLVLTAAGARCLARREPGAGLVLALPLTIVATATLRYLPHGALLALAVTLGLAAVRLPGPTGS